MLFVPARPQIYPNFMIRAVAQNDQGDLLMAVAITQRARHGLEAQAEAMRIEFISNAQTICR